MIAVFQYVKGCYREESINLFSMAPERRTKSNKWKLVRERFNQEKRKNS